MRPRNQWAAEIGRRFPDCDRICAFFAFYPVTDELTAEFLDAVSGIITSDDGVRCCSVLAGFS